MTTDNVQKEITAIGVCMRAVDGLELSEALRVIGYVSDFLAVRELRDHAYKLARQAAKAEDRASSAVDE